VNDHDAAFWDERYRAREAAWSAEINERVADAVAGVTPGRALDAGCGEGADAIWLAEHGWDVTAADISAVALERGRANDPTGRVEWLQADLLVWVPAASSYDLVTAHFIHFPSPQRETMFRRLAAAVRSRGTLLIVAHHPSDLQTTARRPPMPEVFYTADEIAAQLEPEDWEIIDAGAFSRSAVDPDGQSITVHDTVLRARRRSE
jgi:2-polyprenyl-3-methyl-5-hydroxy-6-metoxy-1,4-benzoquinol methylase